MPEIGFVPPVARKKLQNREQRRVKDLRNNRLISLALCIAVVGFVGYNIWYIKSVRKVVRGDFANYGSPRSQGSLRGVAWISKDSQPFNEGKSASQSHHLIMVAGHSVTVSGHLEDAGEDESDWYVYRIIWKLHKSRNLIWTSFYLVWWQVPLGLPKGSGAT
jgi:hypothetical protein